VSAKAEPLSFQAVLAKIQTISQSHVVRPGLALFKDRKPGETITLAKEDIPGLGTCLLGMIRCMLTPSLQSRVAGMHRWMNCTFEPARSNFR
jgi:hypothetical protein